MRLRRSRPFNFIHTARPHSRALRETMGKHRSLGAAAASWDQTQAVAQHVSHGELSEDARDIVADVREEAALQTYLNMANPSAGLGHAPISPFEAEGLIGPAEAAIDRGSAQLGGEPVHGIEMRGTALPFGTAATVGGVVGP